MKFFYAVLLQRPFDQQLNYLKKEDLVRQYCYKIFIILLFISLITSTIFFLLGKGLWGVAFVFLSILILVSQIYIVKCPHCGTRPGKWIPAFWTLAIDFEFYVSDTLLLEKCPKCQKNLFAEVDLVN